MAVTVPVRDMKSTGEFVSLVEKEREVVVTKNGYESIYCISADQRRLEREEMAKAKLLSRILTAEEEFAAGSGEDYSEFSSALRDEYGL